MRRSAQRSIALFMTRGMTMPQSGSVHLLRDFTEERFGQSLSDLDSDSKGSGPEPHMLKKRYSTARSGGQRLHQTIHVISILTILALVIGFIRSRGVWRKACVERQSIYCSSNHSRTISLNKRASSLLTSCPSAPVLDVLSDEYQTWKFNGTFRNFSPYKGPPNGEVDKAWADLFSCTSRPLNHECERMKPAGYDHAQRSTTVGAFRITPSHLRKIGGSSSAAQFPPEAGGGYLGFMEVLHQIHCVVSSSHPSFDYKSLILTWLACSSSELTFVRRTVSGSTSTKTITQPGVRSSRIRRQYY